MKDIKQNMDASADTVTAAKVGDKSANSTGGREMPHFSAIDLWKEAPVLTGQPSCGSDQKGGQENDQHDYVLHGQVVIGRLKSHINETAPLYADLSFDERVKRLEAALIQINPCKLSTLAGDFAKYTDDEKRARIWNQILQRPRYIFQANGLVTREADFDSIQTLVDQRAAFWLRDQCTPETRNTIKQLFYDYCIPVTKTHKYTDNTK